ncbi:ankyrin repeat protein, partial [Lasius niger]
MAKLAISNPLSIAERPEQPFRSALPFLAGLADIHLLRDWLSCTSTEPTPGDVSMALVQATYMGSKETVELILALRGRYSWESEPEIGKALIVAASHTHCEILGLLIRSAPDGYIWPPSLLVRMSELGLKEPILELHRQGCSFNVATTSSRVAPLTQA